MERVTMLSDVGLFRGLNEEQLGKIQRLCRLDKRPPGAVIFKEGDEAVDICVVVEGRVHLRFEMPGRETSQEQTLTTILPGKAFGWSALVPPHKMTLSSYAGEQGCEFFRIGGNALYTVFEENSRVGYLCMRNLTRVIAKRFHEMEDEVARSEGLNLMHQW